MTALTDYIDNMGADKALTMIRATPYWWPLSMAVKSAKDIYHVVAAMQWQELADLQAWVSACNTDAIPNRELWQSLVAPQCSVRALDLGVVTWTVMDTARDQQCNTATDYKRMNSDRDYFIPTEAQLRVIAKACVSWRHQHSRTENGDCDDFVNIARGWLSTVGLGNLSVGKAGTRHFTGEALKYGHALLLSFTREAATGAVTAWWWEPQTGEIHPIATADLGNPSLFPWDKPDIVQLAWCDF